MNKLSELINKNISFAKLFSLFKPHEAGDDQKLPLITISREKGSGGRPIAYLVEKKLRKPWKVYHETIVDEIAKEAKLEKNLIKEIDENNIPFIEELIDDVLGRRYVHLSTYYKQLVKIISTIGQRGDAIIVGRGAEYLLPHALKIRIICEWEQRITWMMEFEKLTRRQAVNTITASDTKRTEFIETLFHHDTRKAHHYDMVIRTSRQLPIEDAADLIVLEARRRFKI